LSNRQPRAQNQVRPWTPWNMELRCIDWLASGWKQLFSSANV